MRRQYFKGVLVCCKIECKISTGDLCEPSWHSRNKAPLTKKGEINSGFGIWRNAAAKICWKYAVRGYLHELSRVDKPSCWILPARAKGMKRFAAFVCALDWRKVLKRCPNCLWFPCAGRIPGGRVAMVIYPNGFWFNHKQFQKWWESHLKLLPAQRAEVWEIASPISTFDRSLSHQFAPIANERNVLLRVFTVVIKFYWFLPSSFFHWAIIVKVIWLLIAFPISPPDDRKSSR